MLERWSMLTEKSKHWLSRIVPQQPRKPITMMKNPTAMRRFAPETGSANSVRRGMGSDDIEVESKRREKYFGKWPTSILMFCSANILTNKNSVRMDNSNWADFTVPSLHGMQYIDDSRGFRISAREMRIGVKRCEITGICVYLATISPVSKVLCFWLCLGPNLCLDLDAAVFGLNNAVDNRLQVWEWTLGM